MAAQHSPASAVPQIEGLTKVREVVEGCSRTRAVSDSSISLRSQTKAVDGRPSVRRPDRRPVHRQVRQLRPATPRVGAACRVHPPELGDPGASRLEVIKGCWAQDRPQVRPPQRR
jgi:hypothetical protein